MEELRLVRRDEQSLVVASESGEEFRLVVDDTVLAELRHLGRKARTGPRVNPREIQSLIRAGKSRSEVAETVGVEEEVIERYEEPVLAERRYILERAQAVPVRTDPVRVGQDESGDEPERFGAVIGERLIALSAEIPEWSSWRDEEAGWMIALEFISHDVEHRAVWSFEHRKQILAPLTPDAVSLSKQGDVGDRLIPKLRAVDSGEAGTTGRFDAETFAGEQVTAPETPAEPEQPVEAEKAPLDPEAEYERRRGIDQRAINTPQPELTDLGQTADLLDALRRRRGERDQALRESAQQAADTAEDAPPAPAPEPEAPRDAAPTERLATVRGLAPVTDPERAAPSETPKAPEASPSETASTDDQGRQGSRKRRASIPSWDDILFGTRSEDDPV